MTERLVKTPAPNRDELFAKIKGSAAEVTEERNATHGDWRVQSDLSFTLKGVMRDSENFHKIHAAQREALDMIATKISRILTGNPYEPDHWADIEGYAYLARKEIERGD